MNIIKFAQNLIQIDNTDNHENLFNINDYLQKEYKEFITLCNGGFTQNGYFHFFGLKGPICHNLISWNDPDVWKKYYALNDKIICFAEDIFGNQFYFDLNQPTRTVIKMLTADNGNKTVCAECFDDFLESIVLCEEIYDDFLKLYKRFLKKENIRQRDYISHVAYITPICLGGNVNENNLELMDPIQHMRISGQISTQAKNLNHGTKILDIDINMETAEVNLITE